MNDRDSEPGPIYTTSDVQAESILLVDDTFVLRDRLAMAMQQRGFRVETAGNYDEAVEVFKQRPTDLAVLDLRMPGRNGLELLRKLLEFKEDTRIIILSGFGSIPASIDAIRSGAVNFLSKPADADDILAAFLRGDEQTVPDGAVAFPAPSLARNEWEHIHRVLADCDGNISEAARRLGIHRRSLQRKLRKRAPEDPSVPDAEDMLDADDAIAGEEAVE
ncbi:MULTISPECIES: response regulator transcription factor [Crateriforma]|uniref:Photosynthetic apparatus regulatory protein RegA n=1 Tax=Crateriforma conspicua TaxID=2527996 RepID=A0A5C6FUM5_9PLAN|nr:MULTISPECIES: response regulator [Crateriforma]QDV64652.1 Photosynthetic apparatus regulatory protein RegA [Crateriforma conspicua]TWT70049.1 Photosynthetic apparatus regulatory protein RegA [Crateriforma conspicua]TWU65984.1 Photosynthetic apparatus regulatory protein RegA [Crateriforma conspicua]